MEKQPDQTLNMDEKLNKSDSASDKTDDLSESSTDNISNKQEKQDGSETDIEDKKLTDANKLKTIKDVCKRTDLSPIAKVDKILLIIEPDQENQSPPQTQKRPLEDENLKPSPKQFKGAADIDADASVEDVEIDSCVVCGLSLRVFKEDTMKEIHHYLSHGFRVLKEFGILKPEDSLFLMCNICDR